MPRYRFRWDNFPPGLLAGLAAAAGIDGEDAGQALRATYGARPKEEFVRDLWPCLLEEWLGKDSRARSVVVKALRDNHVGPDGPTPQSNEGEMEFLRHCRNAKTLRGIVLAQFVLAGETSQSSPGVGSATAVECSDALRSSTASQAEATVATPEALAPVMRGEDLMNDDAGEDAVEPPWVTLTERPAQPLPDIGPEVSQGLYQALMVDDSWAERHQRGFTWWAYRLAQRIEVDEPRLAFGDPVVRVRVTTDLVRDAHADSAQVHEIANLFNMNSALNALVWDRDTESAHLAATAYIHKGNRGLEPFISLVALLQNVEAHSRAHTFAETLQGEPAETHHPSNGVRPDMDDLLNFAEATVVPAGKEPSAFVGDDLTSLERDTHAPWVMATSDPTGMTGELPFTGATPAFVAASLDRGEIGTSLVQVVTSDPHPGYGSGAHLLLTLPTAFESRDHAVEVAASLVAAEAAEPTGFPLIGAWCATPGGNAVAYTAFVPSICARPGLLATLVFYLSLRNDWARDRLASG